MSLNIYWKAHARAVEKACRGHQTKCAAVKEYRRRVKIERLREWIVKILQTHTFYSFQLLPSSAAQSTMATYQFFFSFFLVSIVSCNIPISTGYFDPLDPFQQSDFGPACFRRIYTLKIKQEDSQGRSCWDNVSVVSCWGRCASNEVSSSRSNVLYDIFLSVWLKQRLQIGVFHSSALTIPFVSMKRSNRDK